MSAGPAPALDAPPGYTPSEWRLIHEVLDTMTDVQLAVVGILLERDTAPSSVPRLQVVEDPPPD